MTAALPLERLTSLLESRDRSQIRQGIELLRALGFSSAEIAARLTVSAPIGAVLWLDACAPNEATALAGLRLLACDVVEPLCPLLPARVSDRASVAEVIVAVNRHHARGGLERERLTEAFGLLRFAIPGPEEAFQAWRNENPAAYYTFRALGNLCHYEEHGLMESIGFAQIAMNDDARATALLAERLAHYLTLLLSGAPL